MNLPDNPIIICSTARLARSLKLVHGRRQREQGLSQWQPLHTLTLNQWLADLLDSALLNGEIDASLAPRAVLSALQERILWERVIDSALAGEVMGALFDQAGLAAAAQQANQLLGEWNIRLTPDTLTEETRQFLQWREIFQKQCKQSGWLGASGFFDWQIGWLQSGVGQLPEYLTLAGYDRVSPQLQRLLDVLAAREVKVERYATGLAQPATASHIRLTDQDAECRAVAAWVQQQLQQNLHCRLAVVVPELGALRQRLTAMLDDVLHPATITPLLAEAPRCYDFSLGLPLNTQPIIATALNLLRLTTQRRAEQTEFAALLRQPYWSAGSSEADARARLDARMREWLPLTVSLNRLLRFTQKSRHGEVPLPLARLAADLQALVAALDHQPGKQLPSAWARAFQTLLQAAGWPGERSLSSHEYQAQKAFDKTLHALGELDALLGQIDNSEAARRLHQLCKEQIFQTEAVAEPQVQVMGMLEGLAAPVDAVWVMGMNDHLWPPPPRPNPLLPAISQRAAGVPNADSAVQAAFAADIHQRLLHSAPQIVFSSALKDGERQLRPSTVLLGMAEVAEAPPLAQTLAEVLAHNTAQNLQFEDDHQAPPVAPGEHVSGGSGLLKAQAICPAWAYYQYRLGARALKQPIDGLEAAERGTLVHGVLEHLWRAAELGNGLTDLQTLSPQVLQEIVLKAADMALADFTAQRFEPLPAALVALERERLARLVSAWLAVEAMRPQPFRVTACEQEQTINIEGIAIKLVVDRIDTLQDGRLVLMDYKTGRKPEVKNWADVRIVEPQLPIYAALVLSGGDVAAVCFAMVRTEQHGFSGIAADADVLPKVTALSDEKGREVFSAELFPDWQSLLKHWKSSIEAMARELKGGEAAVRYADEAQLAYCEVLPLLRLPERKLQFERLQSVEDAGT